MAIKIKSDTRELNEILANFQKFTSQTIPVLVRRHARLLAVELANRTQPFSVGGSNKTAAKVGKNAVENDINKVFRTTKTLQSVVDKTENEKLRNKLQNLLNSGNRKKIGEVFKKVGMIDDFELVEKGGLPSKHKDHRSQKSGRSWSPKRNMFIATTGLSSYIKQIQKRVGLAKAQWADCARQIGGIKGDGARGIPAFAKSKNHKTSGSIIDGLKSRNPSITMTSKLPWASRILPKDEIKFAQHIVREKMIKQASIMTRAAAKKNFNPEPTE